MNRTVDGSSFHSSQLQTPRTENAPTLETLEGRVLFNGVIASHPSLASIEASRSKLSAIDATLHGIVSAVPTITTPAAASAISVNGSTTSVSVLGGDINGEAGLTYTWTATTQPSGATVTFATNGTNASKNDLVTFNRAGNYVLQATISNERRIRPPAVCR